VKFHDGHPMTAEDVIFSSPVPYGTLAARPAIFATSEEAKGARSAHRGADARQAVRDVHADVRRHRLAPSCPSTSMTARNTAPILQTRSRSARAVQFVEWQRGNFSSAMKRFDDYWAPGQPYLDEIIYRIIPDSQNRALALQTGQESSRKPTISSRSTCRAFAPCPIWRSS